MRGKRWLLPGACVVLLMCCARCYLMAHFPSDVAAATIIGVLSGWIAYQITRAIFRFFFSRKKGDRLAWYVLNYDLPLPSFLRYKGKH